MGYGLQLVTPPAEEPVTLALLKSHLRVEHDEDDTLIRGLAVAARKFVEKWTGRDLVRRDWKFTLDRLPYPYGAGDAIPNNAPPDVLAIRLPRSPVVAVTAFEYIDEAGDLQLLDPEDYAVDGDSLPARILPAFGLPWPTVRFQMAAVQISLTSGYGSADEVPEDYKVAILLLVGHWYTNREAAAAPMQSLPLAVEAILGLNWDGAMAAADSGPQLANF